MRTQLAVLSLSLFILSATSVLQAQDIAGEWSGEISVPGQALSIEVELDRSGDQWTGTIAIPAQNLSDFNLSDVQVDDNRVGFTMAGIPGTPVFAGEVAEDGARIDGTFSQGGAQLPFYLRRTEAARGDSEAATRAALDGFGDFILAAMDSLAVPGAAVAIVRDGEVVFLEGFGLRNVDASLPVTAQTQFAIGSSTKAFTAAALAALIDDGALDWDTEVASLLPSFRLYDPVATAQMNVVDLLTHRSGLPRHDLLWYASTFDRRELFGRLRHLEPSEPFRAQWQYQNLMYLVAGVLAEEISGQSWEDVVRQRLFNPIGMTEAGFSVDQMQRQPNFASPYSGGRRSIESMDFRRIDAIGPAGSINASIQDMARWVQFNLGDGTVDGQRVISTSALRAMHRPHVVITGQTGLEEAPYLMYGLGWFVEPYRGHRMIHHGGNIDGFSALVGFLPDEQIGVVVLTNKNGSPLPRAVMMTAFDRLLEVDGRDWLQRAAPALPDTPDQEASERVEGTAPSRAVADFAGLYEHPGYGEINITQAGAGLRFDYYTVGGEMEHVHYDTFEFTPETLPVGIRITFQANAQGRVSRLEVPLELTSAPLVFERAPDASLTEPDYLRSFVGTYTGSGLTFNLAMRGQQTLTVSIAGQGTWALIPTETDGFDIEGLSGFRLRFEREGGRVVRLIGSQPGATFAADLVDE